MMDLGVVNPARFSIQQKVKVVPKSSLDSATFWPIFPFSCLISSSHLYYSDDDLNYAYHYQVKESIIEDAAI